MACRLLKGWHQVMCWLYTKLWTHQAFLSLPTHQSVFQGFVEHLPGKPQKLFRTTLGCEHQTTDCTTRFPKTRHSSVCHFLFQVSNSCLAIFIVIKYADRRAVQANCQFCSTPRSASVGAVKKSMIIYITPSYAIFRSMMPIAFRSNVSIKVWGEISGTSSSHQMNFRDEEVHPVVIFLFNFSINRAWLFKISRQWKEWLSYNTGEGHKDTRAVGPCAYSGRWLAGPGLSFLPFLWSIVLSPHLFQIFFNIYFIYVKN